MSFYVLIPLGACIASSILATAILSRDSSHRANRLAALLVGGTAYWALCEVLWNLQTGAAAALVLSRLSTPGWMFIGSLMLDLLLEISGRATLRSRRALPYVYGIPAVFVAVSWFTPWVAPRVVRTSWGWAYEVGAVHTLAVLYIVICVFAALWIGWKAYRTASPGEQSQALWVGGGIIIPLIVAASTDALLPRFGVQLPRLGSAVMTLCGASIAWSFYRYGYSLLAPGAYASEILETLPTGVAMLRVDGRIRSANSTMARLLATTADALVGVHIEDLFVECDVDFKGEATEVECQLRSFVGERVPVSISSTVLCDRRRAPIGFVLVIRDLREVALLRSRLVVSDRLAAVGELAAGISHEINNPLAYVRSNLALLRRHWKALGSEIEKVGTPDYTASLLAESAEMIDESLQGVDRAVAIVRDVKGLAHAGRSEREMADVNDLLDGVVRIAAAHLGRSCAIVKHYSSLPLLSCAPQELQQVFLNLVMNAGQAIDDSGEIRVITAEASDAITVRIEDDGCGIPPDVVERIFDPFFTTKAVGEGTGLGLGIAFEIVRKHGGEISVESELSRGTSFCVRLPLHAGRMEPEP